MATKESDKSSPAPRDAARDPNRDKAIDLALAAID